MKARKLQNRQHEPQPQIAGFNEAVPMKARKRYNSFGPAIMWNMLQ